MFHLRSNCVWWRQGLDSGDVGDLSIWACGNHENTMEESQKNYKLQNELKNIKVALMSETVKRLSKRSRHKFGNTCVTNN